MLKISFETEVVQLCDANVGHSVGVLCFPDYQESRVDHLMVPH